MSSSIACSSHHEYVRASLHLQHRPIQVVEPAAIQARAQRLPGIDDVDGGVGCHLARIPERFPSVPSTPSTTICQAVCRCPCVRQESTSFQLKRGSGVSTPSGLARYSHRKSLTVSISSLSSHVVSLRSLSLSFINHLECDQRPAPWQHMPRPAGIHLLMIGRRVPYPFSFISHTKSRRHEGARRGESKS